MLQNFLFAPGVEPTDEPPLHVVWLPSEESWVFERAHATRPVCAPAPSTLLTGP